MSNPHTVARHVEHYAEAYECAMVQCFWTPEDARRQVAGHYTLTMAVHDELWETVVYPLTHNAFCAKYSGGCPVPYERIECTPLNEMKKDAQTPHGYLLRLVQTYAKGYNWGGGVRN